jgi:hypothetical protein
MADEAARKATLDSLDRFEKRLGQRIEWMESCAVKNKA